MHCFPQQYARIYNVTANFIYTICGGCVVPGLFKTFKDIPRRSPCHDNRWIERHRPCCCEGEKFCAARKTLVSARRRMSYLSPITAGPLDTTWFNPLVFVNLFCCRSFSLADVILAVFLRRRRVRTNNPPIKKPALHPGVILLCYIRSRYPARLMHPIPSSRLLSVL